MLRVLRLYIKVAIFQPELREHAPHTTCVLKVAIFQPELQEHAPRTTFVLKSCDFQAGAAADQGGIEPATAGLRKQARKPRDNFQRPFREQQNRGATARALRHARSPQRVHPGMSKTQKNLEFLHLNHADPRRGSRGHIKKRKKTTSSFCTSTTPISAEGRIPDRRQHPRPPRQERDS